MQAIRIDSFLLSPSFSSLSPTTLPTPKPTGGEFLVRITHVALQHVDLLYAQGKHQNNNARRGHVHPPFILGIDFAGIVLSVPGKERTSCKDIKVGDRVMGSKLGAFAEHICAKKDQIWRVPDNIGNEAAAALAGAAVSYGAVIQMAEVKKGETVLVTGASGGLGIVACQVARALGASVVGLVTSKEKADQLRMQLGVGAVVNRKGWETEVKELAGDGVHAVIDNVGVVESSLRCLRFGGRIVLVGFAGRNGVMEEIAMNKVLLKGARIIGYVSLRTIFHSSFLRIERATALR